MKPLKYNIYNHKIMLKQKYENSNIFLDFRRNVIIIAGRDYDNIDGFIDNMFNDLKLKKEVRILKDLYSKNKKAEILIITSDMLERNKNV